MVCQVDGCRLAGLRLIVDGQLPATERVGHPYFQITGVAFLTIRAEPEEADTIREDLGAPENLQGACLLVRQSWETRCPSLLPQAGLNPGTKGTQGMTH